VIDTWQAKFIVDELVRSQTAFGGAGLLDLPASFLQLFFNEPSLLNKDSLPLSSDLEGLVKQLNNALDNDVATNGTLPTAASSLGLTPVMVSLLGSPDRARRLWARNQITRMSRAIAFDEWAENGVGNEVQSLFLTTFSGGSAEQWGALKAVISADRLKLDTIQRGFLEGRYDIGTPARADRSVMSLIARLLGSPSDSKCLPSHGC
jgi:hypothetical protein